MAIKTWAITDLAGVSDIAKRYGVRSSTVVNWRNRHEEFPDPILYISGMPVFSYRQVAKWHKSKKWLSGKHA